MRFLTEEKMGFSLFEKFTVKGFVMRPQLLK